MRISNTRTRADATSPRVEFRMPRELKREVEEAAALLGSSFTAFATQVLVERAREVTQAHGLTVLCDDARDSFIDMMANPPAPSKALIRTLTTTKVEI